MSTARPSPSLIAAPYFWTTVGSIALVFLGAFESLAVTTIMPTISRELDGEALYSLAFSGTLAASVVGMVVAGGWADTRGPSRPLIAAIAVFLAGLVLSGTATDMVVFIIGRILQGLGSGAITVALYVVVARIYPGALHPRIFGAFAAAWVVPSLIGPPVAGVVAEAFSWHWVFLGVGVLVVIASAAIAPALRQLLTSPKVSTGSASGRSILWAVIVAVAVLAISVGGEAAAPVAVIALIVAVIAVRPLLPTGTLLARRGLPATILLRAAVAGAFFGTEIYLPYYLGSAYGLPSWAAGLILTVGAVSWAGGSAVQSRWGGRVSHAKVVRIGSSLVATGIAVQLAVASLHLSPVVAAVGWLVAGAGMGLVFPRISTLVLAWSSERDQGFNSAAMSIADATGGATTVAFAGLLFAAFGAAGGSGFIGALSLATVVGLVAIPIAFRVRGSGAEQIARPRSSDLAGSAWAKPARKGAS